MAGRKIVRKSREERREESRKLILDSAMYLFYENGYEETTTRDILKKAGILNGSLYNRFKSKEEILLAIVSDAMGDFLSISENALSSGHPIRAFIVPGALMLYISSHSRKAAGLIYNACRSWNAVNMLIDTYSDWAKRVLSEEACFFESEDATLKITGLIGMVGNVCGCYANGMAVDVRHATMICMKGMSSMVDLPVFDGATTVDGIISEMEASDITIGGHRLKDLPDYI